MALVCVAKQSFVPASRGKRGFAARSYGTGLWRAAPARTHPSARLLTPSQMTARRAYALLPSLR